MICIIDIAITIDTATLLYAKQSRYILKHCNIARSQWITKDNVAFHLAMHSQYKHSALSQDTATEIATLCWDKHLQRCPMPKNRDNRNWNIAILPSANQSHKMLRICPEPKVLQHCPEPND